MTSAEGRGVVTAALKRDQASSEKEDCSHVVHQFYHDAGFEYSYASSFELYKGSSNFERVKTPHAGDLIAWPGHVGIVVDPAQHSFYSLVSTGLDTQDYRGPYWTSRGRPRFYRYKVAGTGKLNTVTTAPVQRHGSTKKQAAAVTVAEERPLVERAASNRPSKAAAERKAVTYSPQVPETSETPEESAEIRSSIIIAAGIKKPTRDEVAKGASELTNEAGNILRTEDPMKLPLPIVIFDRSKWRKWKPGATTAGRT